jgi:hypothetical protein
VRRVGLELVPVDVVGRLRRGAERRGDPEPARQREREQGSGTGSSQRAVLS